MKTFLKIFGCLFAIIIVASAGAFIYLHNQFKSFPGFTIRSEKTAVSEAEIFSWIEEIVSFGTRKPGGEADERTRALITASFEEYGLEMAEPEPIAAPTARVEEWGLWLKRSDGVDVTVPAYPMPFPAPTPNGPLEALMEYVGDGTGVEHINVEDKIVVFEQQVEMHKWDLYKRLFFFYDPARSVPPGFITANLLDRTARALHDLVAPRGAAGMVGLLSSLPWESASFCPQLNQGVRMEIPGLWVSRKNSDLIRSRVDDSTPMSRKNGLPAMEPYQVAKMLVTAVHGHSDTFNVWATLPGQLDEYYIVMAHHDAPFDNAVQDASGVSMMLALAKHFSELREDLPLRRGVVFLAVGAHTLGRLGESAFVQNHRKDILPKVALVVSVEHIAKEFTPREDLRFDYSDEPAIRMFFTSGSRKLSGIVQSSIIANDYRRSVMIPQSLVKARTGKARGISGEFYEAGVPVVGLLSNPPYMFFQEDTPATVARDQLVSTVDTIISILRTADTVPFEQFKN